MSIFMSAGFSWHVQTGYLKSTFIDEKFSLIDCNCLFFAFKILIVLQ